MCAWSFFISCCSSISKSKATAPSCKVPQLQPKESDWVMADQTLTKASQKVQTKRFYNVLIVCNSTDTRIHPSEVSSIWYKSIHTNRSSKQIQQSCRKQREFINVFSTEASQLWILIELLGLIPLYAMHGLQEDLLPWKLRCKMIFPIIQNGVKKEAVGGNIEPIFKYGVVRVKYGVDTGSIRVGQTQGSPVKPRVSSYKYGVIRVKYGVYTGSIRVRIFKKPNPNFSGAIVIKTC